jgi:RNase P subunit RPR2
MSVTYLREMNPGVVVGCLDCGWQTTYPEYEEAKSSRASHVDQCPER